MFLELVNNRYSVRQYQDKEIEKEKLLTVIEAARLAPSAVNYQPLHYIIVSDPEKKEKLMESYPRKWISSAPTIIIVCLDRSKSWKRRDGKDHGDIDGGIAIEHMALAATNIGLGTCIVCAFDSKKVHNDLELPSNMEVIALLPIGYPADQEIPDKKRDSLKYILSWEEYQRS